MSNRRAILFVSKPAAEGEKTGYTLRFDAETMELLGIIDDRPFCKVHSEGDRLNTKYIPEYEDLQHDVIIGGGLGEN